MPAQSIAIVVKINDNILLTKDWYEPRRHLIEVSETFFECQSEIINIFSEYKLGSQDSSEISRLFFIKLADFLKSNGLKITSLYSAIDNKSVLNLMVRALKVNDYRAENLLNFFLIEVSSDKVASILLLLEGFEGIAYCYQRGVLYKQGPGGQSAGGNTGIYPNIQEQVRSFFSSFGGDGILDLNETLKIIDVEQGWDMLKVRSRRTVPTIGSGVSYNDLSHGTKTLNVILGQQESGFVNGLCRLTKVYTASTWYAALHGEYLERREAALAEVLGSNQLSAGDIILLELQQTIPFGGGKLWPVEADPAMLHTVTYGVASGVIIVSAAGNGDHDIGDLIKITYEKMRPATNLGLFATRRHTPSQLNRFSSIMVGAQVDGLRAPLSNFGHRVDCYCFGAETNNYWVPSTVTSPRRPATFGGTSLASAVIASLAGNMQLLARRRGREINPVQMKEFLKSMAYQLPVPASFLRFLTTPAA